MISSKTPSNLGSRRLGLEAPSVLIVCFSVTLE
jgi:hypothetical protein